MGREMLRYAQHDRTALSMTVAVLLPLFSPNCHPERSEGSLSLGREMLRCAQHDRTVPYCRAIATRSRSSGLMKWSLSSTPASNCTQLILPLNALVCIV